MYAVKINTGRKVKCELTTSQLFCHCSLMAQCQTEWEMREKRHLFYTSGLLKELKIILFEQGSREQHDVKKDELISE